MFGNLSVQDGKSQSQSRTVGPPHLQRTKLFRCAGRVLTGKLRRAKFLRMACDRTAHRGGRIGVLPD
jgi:hypothetical protein